MSPWPWLSRRGAYRGAGFAENGAHVYVASRKPDADAVAKLKGSGHVEAVAADLTRPAGRTQLREWLAERTARVDVLVNNSGTNWNAPIDQYPEHGASRSRGPRPSPAAASARR